MGYAQKFGLAMAALVVGLVGGYLVFRPTMRIPPSTYTQAVTVRDSVATRAAAPAPFIAPQQARLASAPAAHDAEIDREARIGAIDQELRDMPQLDSHAAEQLAYEIKLRREQVEELRGRVSEMDHALGLAPNGPVPGAERQLELEANSSALQGRLNDAKESVSEQRREIGWIAASNDPAVITKLHGELARRSGVVAAIEQEIRDLFATQRSDLEAAAAQRTASINTLRKERNSLADAYNEAVAGLTEAQARYQQVLSDLASSRSTVRSLSNEKMNLLQR